MRQQRGAALLVILMIAGVLGAFFAVRALNGVTAERDKVTATALAQAKDALIGFAVTYRDTHADEVFGFLPCPDLLNNDGVADSCGASQVSRVGRLPWRTLGLPPLRDSTGECLWYAVSGSAKDLPKLPPFNWDTTGQFIVADADGVNLAGATAHGRPYAVVFAPRSVVGAQNRNPAGATADCGGSSTAAAANYLETVPSTVAGANSTLTFSTLASTRLGTNNDQGIWVAGNEIFNRVQRRRDFKTDLDTMMDDLSFCLNGRPLSDPVFLASAGNKGVDNIVAGCPANGPQKINVMDNWRDNLLYTRPIAAATVNGSTGCNAVLFFSGERTVSQNRAAATDRLLAVNYLEGTNASLFPNTGAYSGALRFDQASASADVVRCIKGLPAGATQQSFATNFSSFVSVGAGVTPTAATQSVNIADAAGGAGGCFWSPTPIPLAGKTLRAYYDFKFAFADPFALTSVGADRGNGFSLQMVTGQFGTPPNTCGTEVNMGVLGAADVWGADSIIFETDVRRDAASADPAENHSAILLDGFLDHAPSAPGSTITTACNGTATGCRHTPANKFEEASPQTHNQRIEIHTGCNATCSVCNPPAHAVPNNYARITAWSDCKDCNDTATDIDRVTTGPTIQRCVALNTVMNTVFFGFTGGFRSGTSQQGVTVNNLYLRSD